jgi:sigma-B regulation protein RsbU (phosphoserine phosphatase)
MVRAISLARLLARDIVEPERILARLNDELAVDNPSGMFVTFICVVFEPASGRLTLANAGHCRPLLLAAGQEPRWALDRLGTALGFEPGLQFERSELTLRPGDTLVLYSDGVTEAFDPQQECYGNERLLTDARAFTASSATDITTTLLDRVRHFAAGSPQSDDIAILSLKINGTPASDGKQVERLSLNLQATPEEVMRAVETLQQFAQAHCLPEKTIFALALSLEECGCNVVNHALRRDRERSFQVSLQRTGRDFIIEVRDPGPEFDPTTAPSRKPQAEDNDLPGGWGIELVRRNIDEIRYRRADGENILRLTKHIPA